MTAPPLAGEGRVKIVCRFDTQAPTSGSPGTLTPGPSPASGRGEFVKLPVTANGMAGLETPVALSDSPLPLAGEGPGVRVTAARVWADPDDEPGTVPAVKAATLASLVVRSEAGQFLDAFPLGVGGAIIGRGKQAGNTIVLPNDTMMSKKHARIVWENNRFVLHDENSTNGTFVVSEGAAGEVPLVPNGPGRVLRDGDQIRLGGTTLLFRESGAAAATPVPFAMAPANSYEPNYGVSGIVGGSFVLVAGDGETFPLASEMMVGRSLTGDIVLIGNGVAYQHARLTAGAEAVTVEDLGSPGGTFVNGEKIPARFPVVVRTGDQVAFGEVLLHLEQKGRGV